jgi:hypothetical protein
VSEEVSLKTYVDQRFKDLNSSVDQRFTDQDLSTKTALASAEKAVDKAEASGEKWRENANEWRGAMQDRERNFLTRKEFYAIIGTAIAVIGFLVFLAPYIRGK